MTAPCGSSAPSSPGPDIPVAVLPAGTGNLLARNLGISLDLDDALAEVLDGTEQRIDSVLIEGDELTADRFVVMAGLGLDAAIIADAPDDLKKRVGWAAYVVSTLKNLNHPSSRSRSSSTTSRRYAAGRGPW